MTLMLAESPNSFKGAADRAFTGLILALQARELETKSEAMRFAWTHLIQFRDIDIVLKRQSPCLKGRTCCISLAFLPFGLSQLKAVQHFKHSAAKWISHPIMSILMKWALVEELRTILSPVEVKVALE